MELIEPKNSPLILSIDLPETAQITFNWSIKGSYSLIVGASQQWETFYPIGELYIDDSTSNSGSIRSNSSSKYNSSTKTISLGKGKHVIKFTADHTGATLLISDFNIICTQQTSSNGGGATNGFEINSIAPRKVKPFEDPIVITADGENDISSLISNLSSDHEYWVRSYIKPLYSNPHFEQTWFGSYSPLTKVRTLPVYPHQPEVPLTTQSTATITAKFDGGDAEILSGGIQYMSASGINWTDFPFETYDNSKQFSGHVQIPVFWWGAYRNLSEDFRESENKEWQISYSS